MENKKTISELSEHFYRNAYLTHSMDVEAAIRLIKSYKRHRMEEELDRLLERLIASKLKVQVMEYYMFDETLTKEEAKEKAIQILNK